MVGSEGPCRDDLSAPDPLTPPVVGRAGGEQGAGEGGDVPLPDEEAVLSVDQEVVGAALGGGDAHLGRGQGTEK